MIIAKSIEVSISDGNLQKFLKNKTLPKIVVKNVNKLGNYCTKKKKLQ
jgi:ribosomal protein L7Ae-like RNA K-turn-binding protein